MEIRIDEKSLNKVLKKLCLNITSDLRSFAIEKIVEDGSVDTGHLMKSSHLGEITELGFGDVQGVVSFDAPYAACVEFGTYPGYYPPFPKIHKWVVRKLGIKDKNEAKKVTNSIIFSINKRGTMPHPFVRPAIMMIKEKYK